MQELKEWLEIANYLSTVTLAVVAILALRQISLAKQQIETTKELFKKQSKRASIEATINECKRFADHVIQDHIKIIEHCQKNNITFFSDVKFQRDGDSITVDATNAKKEDAPKLKEMGSLLTSFCNGLEAHAMYFLSGIADENIAYHTNAQSYLDLCEDAYKIFASAGKKSKDIDAIQTLYFRWATRMEKDELAEQQIEINKKLSTFNQTPIRPIGR